MKTESLEELQRQWWAQWWRRDYSWDGLARKRVSGWYVDEQGGFTRSRGTENAHAPLYLQDVWRAEVDYLVKDPFGKLWTVVHAPLTWSDGSTAKSRFAPVHRRRLNPAIEAAAARFPEDPGPRRARKQGLLLKPFLVLPRAKGVPLDGAVLPIIPPAVTSMKHLRGDHMALTSWTLKGVESAYLRHCLIEEDFTIENIDGGHDIRLFASLIVGAFTISIVRIARLRFARLVVGGQAFLQNIKAGDRLTWPASRFHRSVTLEDIEAPDISLGDCRIEGNLELTEVRGGLNLEGAHIGGTCKASALVLDMLNAVGLEIDGKAVFTDLIVTDTADFSDTSWGKSASFSGAKLTKLTFENAELTGKAWFDDAVFTGPVSFSGSHFHNAASFRAVAWEGEGDDHAGAFRQTRFDSFVDFQTADFEAFSAFNGANFKSEIRFTRTLFANDSRVHRVLRLTRTDAAKVELEYGFRALKQAAEVVRDRNLEQAFFRYELLARRSQKLTPASERFLSRSYGLVSNYGASFLRPAIAAMALWTVFVFIYLLLGLCSGAAVFEGFGLPPGRPHPVWATVVDLSSRSMFNLFGVWSLRPPSGDALTVTQQAETALLHASPLVGVLTRLASSAQSVLAGMLLFLVALAARRRFQIS